MRTTASLLWLLLLWLPVVGWAQLPTPAPRQVKVVTWSGERYEGLLEAVTDSVTVFTFAERKKLAFDEIRRVVVYREWTNKRVGALEGAVAGGLGVGFLTGRSLQKSPPRSPVVYGVTLVVGVGAGGLAGGLAGVGLHRLLHRAVRISNRSRNDARLRGRLLAAMYE
jgi:hypothetical protein